MDHLIKKYLNESICENGRKTEVMSENGRKTEVMSENEGKCNESVNNEFKIMRKRDSLHQIREQIKK